MKNYKLQIINGSGALRAILVGRLRRGNNSLGNFFFFTPKALKTRPKDTNPIYHL
jgi:hypothetical protein